ncbi:hypothetical protein HDU93_009338 [Gonapodya sp. JEL0774]|nr:hypothetical protein HDU93_009338 [Gonapodya sp. JEL0774]
MSFMPPFPVSSLIPGVPFNLPFNNEIDIAIREVVANSSVAGAGGLGFPSALASPAAGLLSGGRISGWSVAPGDRAPVRTAGRIGSWRISGWGGASGAGGGGSGAGQRRGLVMRMEMDEPAFMAPSFLDYDDGSDSDDGEGDGDGMDTEFDPTMDNLMSRNPFGLSRQRAARVSLRRPGAPFCNCRACRAADATGEYDPMSPDDGARSPAPDLLAPYRVSGRLVLGENCRSHLRRVQRRWREYLSRSDLLDWTRRERTRRRQEMEEGMAEARRARQAARAAQTETVAREREERRRVRRSAAGTGAGTSAGPDGETGTVPITANTDANTNTGTSTADPFSPTGLLGLADTFLSSSTPSDPLDTLEIDPLLDPLARLRDANARVTETLRRLESVVGRIGRHMSTRTGAGGDAGSGSGSGAGSVPVDVQGMARDLEEAQPLVEAVRREMGGVLGTWDGLEQGVLQTEAGDQQGQEHGQAASVVDSGLGGERVMGTRAEEV